MGPRRRADEGAAGSEVIEMVKMEVIEEGPENIKILLKFHGSIFIHRQAYDVKLILIEWYLIQYFE